MNHMAVQRCSVHYTTKDHRGLGGEHGHGHGGEQSVIPTSICQARMLGAGMLLVLNTFVAVNPALKLAPLQPGLNWWGIHLNRHNWAYLVSETGNATGCQRCLSIRGKFVCPPLRRCSGQYINWEVLKLSHATTQAMIRTQRHAYHAHGPYSDGPDIFIRGGHFGVDRDSEQQFVPCTL
jgi:hypothetical protein